jgi:hypothetical protein
VMLVFGATMFLLGRRGQRRPVEKIEGTTRPLGHGGH